MNSYGDYLKRFILWVNLTALTFFVLYAVFLLGLPDWIAINVDSIPMTQRGVLVISAVLTLVVFIRVKPRPIKAGLDLKTIPDNGHDFEAWVARALRDEGWKAEVTRGSGDQGVDVIASRGRVRLGVQCKRYKGSVGNKAVQEIYAGVAFYKLTHAAVVTNSYYTPSAKQLASRTGVHLLTCRDLPHLWKQLK